MLIKYFPAVILAALLLAIAFYFKPVSIFLMQSYASALLDENVTVQRFDIMDSSLRTSIGKEANIADITLLQISPLRLKVHYKGNIDAFSKYQPLKGEAVLDGEVTYDERLHIKADASLYEAKIHADIEQQGKKNYRIDGDVRQLNLQSFEMQNNKKYALAGRLNAQFSWSSDKDISLKLQSKEVTHKQKIYKDIAFNLQLKEKIFRLTSNFTTPKRGEIHIKSSGLFDKELQAKAEIDFQNRHIVLSSVRYTKDKELQIDSPIFDGKLSLSLKEKRLAYVLKHINIQKAAQFIDKKLPAKGYVYAKGFVNLATLQSRFELHLPQLKTGKLVIKDIEAEGSSCFKKLNFTLSSNIAGNDLAVEGEADFNHALRVKLFTTKFDSETSLVYEKNIFKLHAKHLNLLALQRAFNLPQYAAANVDIEVKGDIKNIDFTLHTKSIKILKYSKYFKESAAVSVNGKLSKNIVTFRPLIQNRNFVFAGDKSTYDIKTKRLYLASTLKLFDENATTDINMKLHTMLKKPYNSRASLRHEKDKIEIYDFSYTKVAGLKSDFSVDIKELQRYKKWIKRDLSGPANIRGRYNKNLVVTTPSLGGHLEAEIEKDAVFVHFEALELNKIDNLLNTNKLFDDGYLSGNVSYHIPTKSADTYITASHVVLNGIDLDAKLSNIENTIGLNVVSMGRNLLNSYLYTKQKTLIEKAQINLSMNNKIITLNDVALATKKFRIAALGKIRDDGKIVKLSVNILEKHGCSILTQDLSGNIRDPKVINTSGAIIDVVSHMPSAILNTGKKIIKFGANSVDSVVSYAVNTAHLSDKKVSLTSNVTTGAENLIGDTASFVLPNECKVVYRGKVPQPKLRSGL